MAAWAVPVGVCSWESGWVEEPGGLLTWAGASEGVGAHLARAGLTGTRSSVSQNICNEHTCTVFYSND